MILFSAAYVFMFEHIYNTCREIHETPSYLMLIITFFNEHACQKRQILSAVSDFAKHGSLFETMILILRTRV